MANVRERIDSAPRHPWDKFAIVAQMQFEPVRETVVPCHDVRHERPPLERRRDAKRFDRGESASIDMRIRCRNARRKSRAELFKKIRRGMDESSLAACAYSDRSAIAAMPRHLEAIAFEQRPCRIIRFRRVAELDHNFSVLDRRVR